MAGARELQKWSPWLLGGAAILVALAVSWLAYALQSVRHDPFVDGRNRVLTFFGLGQVEWAVAVLLAVALVAASRRFDVGRPVPGLRPELVPMVLLVAVAIVAGSAVIDVLVELTNLGNGIDDAITGLIQYLAVLPLAAAAGLWADRLRSDPTQ